ncbi:unnamed protein product [Musa textilis]
MNFLYSISSPSKLRTTLATDCLTERLLSDWCRMGNNCLPSRSHVTGFAHCQCHAMMLEHGCPEISAQVIASWSAAVEVWLACRKQADTLFCSLVQAGSSLPCCLSMEWLAPAEVWLAFRNQASRLFCKAGCFA